MREHANVEDNHGPRWERDNSSSYPSEAEEEEEEIRKPRHPQLYLTRKKALVTKRSSAEEQPTKLPFHLKISQITKPSTNPLDSEDGPQKNRKMIDARRMRLSSNFPSSKTVSSWRQIGAFGAGSC